MYELRYLHRQWSQLELRSAVFGMLAADAAKSSSSLEAGQVERQNGPNGAARRCANNTPEGHNIPTEWNIGEIDYRTGTWNPTKSKNVKWVAQARLANLRQHRRRRRSCLHRHEQQRRLAEAISRPITILGVLLCFDIKDGKFLWQHSSEKMPTGRVHDWPLQGVCSTPLVEGNRLWFVTNRGEVRCLDTEGFYDGKNDGPYKSEDNENKDEADVIWVFDMMKELGVSQHNMCRLLGHERRRHAVRLHVERRR